MSNYPYEISIVVLIHDVSRYLSKCLDSILKQDFNKPIEVLLLVDAGTKDDYSALKPFLKDLRFKQYSLDFHNPGEVRNFGLKTARGKYIYIIDGDDYLRPNCLSSLYNKEEKENSDIVIANYYIESKGKKRRPFNVYHEDKKINDNEKLARMLYHDIKIRGYTWNKLFRKSFLDEYQFKFLNNHYFLEDFSFSFLTLLYAKKVSFIKDFVYVYVYHPNSISRANGTRRINRFVYTFALLRLYCYEKQFKKATKIWFFEKKFFLFTIALQSRKTLKGKFIKTVRSASKAIKLIKKEEFESFKKDENFYEGYLTYINIGKKK